MKFKIGDKVKIIKTNWTGRGEEELGKIGVITEQADFDKGERPWRVEEDGEYRGVYAEDELELVEDKPQLKFTVGDKVRVIKCFYDTKEHEGVETVIEEIIEEGYSVKNQGCMASEVELIVTPEREEVKEKETAEETRYDTSYMQSVLDRFYKKLDSDIQSAIYRKRQPKQTLMKKVSTLARKLFDADTRALVEAGYLFDDLTLSSEGKNVLLDMLFLQYKKQMAVEARKAIRAAKKCEEDEETEE